MKVLICIPCLLTGGTEIQTLNLVRALVGAGHDVLTACYFEHADAMVGRFRQAGSRVCLFSPDGGRVGGWRGLLFLFRALRRVVRTFRPDVAHVQYMAPGAQPIVMLRLLGVRCVVATTHTDADIYASLRVVHLVERRLVHAFTCITERAERSYFGTSCLYDEGYKLRRHNHFTIYNALPWPLPAEPVERTFSEPLTVGVVSRLERIKGMDLVVPAFAEVRRRCPGVRLLIVGDGTLRPLMERQARELGCIGAVEWAGRQPQDTLPALYGRMDIVWMPSRSEGFGLTAIEAMACGCVVVAARTGGLPEVVPDGEVGLLHEPESTASLTEKTVALIENPARLTEMSHRAARHVRRFSFERYARLFADLYGKLGATFITL